MVKIVETSVRDGHQSLFATRMTTDEVVKLCRKYDEIGYHAIGGVVELPLMPVYVFR